MTTETIGSRGRTGWRPVLGVTGAYVVGASVAVYAVPSILSSFGWSPRAATTGLFAAIAIVEVVLGGLVLRRIRAEGSDLRPWGFHPEVPVAAMLVAVALGVGWALFGLGFAGSAAPGTVQLGEVSLFRAFAVFVAAGLGAGAEELVFRGWMIEHLRRMGQSTRVQVVVSGIAFAAEHGLGAVGVLPLGLALGELYVTVGRRSLLPVFVCHALINVIMEPWFFLAVVTSTY